MAIDPDAIVTLDQFRAIASALVCEHSLRCGRSTWFLAESYCHPGFARLAAARAGRLEGPLDVRLARACVAALLEAPTCDAALRAAEVCRWVSEGPLGAPCADASACGPAGSGIECIDGACRVPGEGEPCVRRCEPGLACIGGRCATGLVRGAACAADGDCAAGLGCVHGRCDLVPEGAACSGTDPCAPGTRCSVAGRCERIVALGDCCEHRSTGGWWGGTREPRCDVGDCVEGRCEPAAAIGCPCRGELSCPLDVAECIEGVCVARPMPGETCATRGPACFASACRDGVCQLGRLGDGCGHDADCGAPLVCAASGFAARCGPLLGEGHPCGDPALPGRCADGLVCGESRLCRVVSGSE